MFVTPSVAILVYLYSLPGIFSESSHQKLCTYTWIFHQLLLLISLETFELSNRASSLFSPSHSGSQFLFVVLAHVIGVLSWCHWSIWFHTVGWKTFVIFDYISQLGFLPWCFSDGVYFNPVCTVNHITLSARLALSVKPIVSSNKLLSIFQSLLRVQPLLYRSDISVGCIEFQFFSFLQFSLFSWHVEAPPRFDFIFSGTPYSWQSFPKSLTSFGSVFLHLRITGLLLYLSIGIRISESPVRLLTFRKRQFEFFPGSVSTGRLFFSVNSNW